MKITNLHLKNYRNYIDMDICFDSNLNIIVGNNAQGKSNILESIFVLALTKSYINVKDHYLINDEKEFSVIKGEFSTDDVEKELEVVITQNSKKLKVNHVEVKKYSDYISNVKVLIFSPYNVNFIKDGPSVRRKSINMVISQYSNNYVKLLQNYNLILKKRNQYLKLIDYRKDYNRFYFDALNNKFCMLCVDIVLERHRYVREINRFLGQIYYEITGYLGLSLNYISNVDFFSNKDEMVDKCRLKVDSFFDREITYGMTMLGPHRDDFSFLLNNKDLAIFGSQGQIRAAILSLKLAEVLIFKDRDDDYPILLLDDIFSELDVEKRNRVMKYILNDVQTIITTTDVNLIDDDLVNASKLFVVKDGKIISDGKKECSDE